MSRLRDLVRSEPQRGFRLPVWLERLASMGIVTADPEAARRQRFTNVGALAIAANAASHFVINGIYGFQGLTVIHIYNALVTVAALLVHRLHRFGDNAAAFALLPLIMGGNLFVVWMLGRQSSLHVYFTLAGAMLFMFGVERWRLFLAWFAVACAALIGVIEFAPEHGLLM